jgi:enoyl-CoA hydratase/carnithine racemase
MFESYAHRFPNFAFERRDGILQISLHTDGGPLVFDERCHEDFGEVFLRVGQDRANRIVILTGTGDRFCTDFNYASFIDMYRRLGQDAGYAKVISDGRRMLQSFVDLEIPVISAVNGLAHTHGDLPVIADVVLASENAEFRDAAHFIVNAVPGDGSQFVWMTLLGQNAGRYFLLTGQKIGAREAQRLGFVAEVLSQDKLLPRAWELASQFASRPDAVLRGTRYVINNHWRKLFHDQFISGFAQEVLALYAVPLPENAPARIDLRTVP